MRELPAVCGACGACGATDASGCGYPELAADTTRRPQGCLRPWPDVGAASSRETPASLPTLEEAAYHGIAGNWARSVASSVEANPVGILAATLVAAGNAVGPSPHVMVGPTRHSTNLSLVLVGPTGSGRKGETIEAGFLPVRRADAEWAKARVRSGLGSGEAVIRLLDDGDGEGERPDRRLLMREGELASVLTVAGRDGSTLSSVLRNAWDGAPLESTTKAATLRATDHHVSLVAAITPDELRRKLTATETANGFANRLLFVATRRTRLLPRGKRIEGRLIDDYAQTLAGVFATARKLGRIDFDAAGGKLWDDEYPRLSGDRPGLVGAITGRADAQTLRLALLYAVLDGHPAIGEQHVVAALALWDYCEQSVRLVWGDALGDADADTILAALHDAGVNGLTRSQVRDLFARHRRAADLENSLATLEHARLITAERHPTAGAPFTVYRLARTP